MAPGRVLDVLLDGLGALDGGAGKGLGEGDGLVAKGLAGDVDRLVDGLKIGVVVAGAGIELCQRLAERNKLRRELTWGRWETYVVEEDVGDIARVGGGELQDRKSVV